MNHVALDAAIGRHIGLEPEMVWNPKQHYNNLEVWPPLSREIGSAWLMVKWMREAERNWLFVIWYGRTACAKFCKFPDTRFIAECENPATAIALAFCAANGIEVPE